MDVIWQQQGFLSAIREFINLLTEKLWVLYCWPVLYRNLPRHGVLPALEKPNFGILSSLTT